jgi:hypothetical protein
MCVVIRDKAIQSNCVFLAFLFVNEFQLFVSNNANSSEMLLICKENRNSFETVQNIEDFA